MDTWFNGFTIRDLYRIWGLCGFGLDGLGFDGRKARVWNWDYGDWGLMEGGKGWVVWFLGFGLRI